MGPVAPGMSDRTKKLLMVGAAAALVLFVMAPKSARAATRPAAPPPDNEAREIPAEAAPSVTYTTYTVQSGDSLSQIASNVYGDGLKPSSRGNQNWRWWPLIYDLNADVIKHPSKIRVGMVLKIPKASDLPMERKDEYFARSMTF